VSWERWEPPPRGASWATPTIILIEVQNFCRKNDTVKCEEENCTYKVLLNVHNYFNR